MTRKKAISIQPSLLVIEHCLNSDRICSDLFFVFISSTFLRVFLSFFLEALFFFLGALLEAAAAAVLRLFAAGPAVMAAAGGLMCLRGEVRRFGGCFGAMAKLRQAENDR